MRTGNGKAKTLVENGESGQQADGDSKMVSPVRHYQLPTILAPYARKELFWKIATFGTGALTLVYFLLIQPINRDTSDLRSAVTAQQEAAAESAMRMASIMNKMDAHIAADAEWKRYTEQMVKSNTEMMGSMSATLFLDRGNRNPGN